MSVRAVPRLDASPAGARCLIVDGGARWSSEGNAPPPSSGRIRRPTYPASPGRSG